MCGTCLSYIQKVDIHVTDLCELTSIIFTNNSTEGFSFWHEVRDIRSVPANWHCSAAERSEALGNRQEINLHRKSSP